MVAELCDWVYVIYAGVIVEQARSRRIRAARPPVHPGPVALDADGANGAGGARVDPRSDPLALGSPPGCRFAERCPHRFGRCAAEPPDVSVGPDHFARCWLLDGGHA